MAKEFKYAKRKIRLEKEREGEDNFELVTINGMRTKVKRGVTVEVSYPVYAVLRARNIAIETAREHVSEKTQEI